MRVLTTEAMQQVDRRAIEELGIPGMVLMENAAIGVADALGDRFPDAATVVVLCGPGNNGGDGLALARHLEARGYRYRIFLVVRGAMPSGDAGTQLAILERSEIPVTRVGPDDSLEKVVATCRAADVVVDALFGTGLSRPLEGHFAELVRALEHRSPPILAVDLPSGLDGGRPEPPGPHLRAQLTVTFAAPKVAHVLPPASQAIGELVVTDLGIPPRLVEEAPGDLHLLTAGEMAGCVVPRSAAAHKGDYGHVLLVAGGPGKAGAAILATRAAVRGGAGLVTVAVPAPLLATVDGGCLESMTLPLTAETGGHLAAAALDELLTVVEGKAALAVGPGLGLAEGTVSVVRRLVAETTLPLVLDADGLNAHVGRLAELAERRGPTVLTPHPGEAARLLGLSSREVQADRLAAVRRLAEESGSVVVLKGHRSLIADPEGGVWINPTGNPGMASGGSGDALTGLLVALSSQGLEPATAAQLAVYLHGLAGDLALVPGAPEALTAGDLVDHLGAAFATLRAA